MQKISPFLWFDNNVEEALNFYASVFKNSKIGHVTRTPEGGPGEAGSALVGTIEIEGTEFILLNGGPLYKFTEAVSFLIHTENQAETDYYWDQLSEGGETSMCGWLKDRFGLSWQVTPNRLLELMSDPDREKAGRVMQCMMQMTKIDVAALEAAAGR